MIPIVLKVSSNFSQVYVRRFNVGISPLAIFEYYDVSYYEENDMSSLDLNLFTNIDMDVILQYLTEGRGEWKREAKMGHPLSFKQTITFPLAKLWMQFICIQRYALCLIPTRLMSF